LKIIVNRKLVNPLNREGSDGERQKHYSSNSSIRKDSTGIEEKFIEELFDHWILGQGAEDEQPRWSIIRDVLGWID
jgi:hypothetical protein